MFWFFGPTLAALYCAHKVSGWIGSVWGLTETACAAVAIKAGAAASVITIPFGTVMADATALLGFLTLGTVVLATNARILKTIANGVLKFSASAGVGAIPIIGALPVFTFTLWRLYRTQIRLEKEAFQKWEKETAAARLQERDRQAAYGAQIQAARQAQFQQEQLMQQEAVNEAQYEQNQEAANEDEYIPQQMDKVA